MSIFRLASKALPLIILFLALTLMLNGCGFFGRNNSAVGAAAAKTAKKYIGVPYVLGGNTPRGFDCSGLTRYVYDRHGVTIPRSSTKQAKFGRFIKKPYLRPGDLVFFSAKSNGVVTHVGIYIGNEKFVHAPGTGKKVTTASLGSTYFRKTYHSARRMI